MPKNPKTEPIDSAAQPSEDGSAIMPADKGMPAKKKGKSVKPATARKTAAKKNASRGATKKTVAAPRAKKPKAYEPTDAEIRLRAYFIAERRAQLGIEGDPSNDWLEARQQLMEEGDGHTAS